MPRPNLTVLTDALVTSVIIEGGQATGVTYLRHGETKAEYVNAEVILSGGAINSPQLLMLSGIGPADHLIELGITVQVDSKGVGANLSDHPLLPVIWSTPRLRSLWEKGGNLGALRWQLTHRGPLTSNLAESGGFAHSEPGNQAPDLQLHVLPGPFLDQGLADPAQRAMTVLVGLVDVASRGRIRLRSPDPRHRPAIDPGYLSETRDARALVAGLKLAREFVTAKPWRRLQERARPRRAHKIRRRAPAVCPDQRGDPLPPRRHLRDGRRQQVEQRAGSRTKGPRDRKPARRRRVGDADRAARQHQRAHDRDRRARRRPIAWLRPAGRRRPRRPGGRHGHHRKQEPAPWTRSAP